MGFVQALTKGLCLKYLLSNPFGVIYLIAGIQHSCNVLIVMDINFAFVSAVPAIPKAGFYF